MQTNAEKALKAQRDYERECRLIEALESKGPIDRRALRRAKDRRRRAAIRMSRYS
jgi:hypothetical protein